MGPWRVVFYVGPCSRQLSTENKELWPRLDYLEETGYVEILSKSRGQADIRIRKPPAAPSS